MKTLIFADLSYRMQLNERTEPTLTQVLITEIDRALSGSGKINELGPLVTNSVIQRLRSLGHLSRQFENEVREEIQLIAIDLLRKKTYGKTSG